MKVSVLGLGAMGMPMATHLSKSFETRVYDVYPPSLESARSAGLAVGASAVDAASEADVVVVVVRDGQQLESVLFGAEGIASSLPEGSVVVVTSTVGEDLLVSTAQRLAELGVQCVDAALSGGPVRAAQGDLVLMVGGEEAAVSKAKPVLESLSSTLCVVGDRVGQGQQLKAVNQLLCGIHTAAAAEALAFAHRLGLDLDLVIDVLGNGAAQSFMFLDRGPRMAQQLRGEEPPLRSRLDVIGKDMGIVGEMTRQQKLSTPVAGAAEQLYRLVESAGYSALDDSIVATFLEGLKGGDQR